MLEINCHAGFANERVEIHVLHANDLCGAGCLGKLLEAVDTFVLILFPFLCLK